VLEDLIVRMGVPAGWVEVLHLGLLSRLLLAAVLGGLVGLEREISGKPAGLRTNLLICVGAALLMELSIGVAELANAENEAQGAPFRADPARIAAQIVSGIGFLGAGTILQARGNVVGLTTAATIWVVAAIGMAVGARAYVVAVGCTILVLSSLMLLGRIERVVVSRLSRQRYLFVLDPDPDLIRLVHDTFARYGLHVETESLEKKDEIFEASFDASGARRLHEQVLRALLDRPGIRRMTRVI
jgi:putative Mg2+ transporter-C (MgtC) family protein